MCFKTTVLVAYVVIFSMFWHRDMFCISFLQGQSPNLCSILEQMMHGYHRSTLTCLVS
jgi:hypothetical protein